MVAVEAVAGENPHGPAGVIISLVLVELGLRFLGVEYPIFYDYDPDIGNKLQPGVIGYYYERGERVHKYQ